MLRSLCLCHGFTLDSSGGGAPRRRRRCRCADGLRVKRVEVGKHSCSLLCHLLLICSVLEFGFGSQSLGLPGLPLAQLLPLCCCGCSRSQGSGDVIVRLRLATRGTVSGNVIDVFAVIIAVAPGFHSLAAWCAARRLLCLLLPVQAAGLATCRLGPLLRGRGLYGVLIALHRVVQAQRVFVMQQVPLVVALHLFGPLGHVWVQLPADRTPAPGGGDSLVATTVSNHAE
mmetsp:Transcript_20029/g.60545  ORF Transcript_20029/g.60545 Transcript_20029/m.60545 type:complete len:228 (-) Transcript_20029:1819-2502(-)